ncbi:UNVERIFIED_CONTAM: hypothetical protein FKN15_070507 [Acipenser sinensis]
MRPDSKVQELPEDFYIPIPLDTNNITSLSPFLVPQTHLASPAVFMCMAAFMLVLMIAGFPINALTIVCTVKYKKLRSHFINSMANFRSCMLKLVFCGKSPFGEEEDVSSQVTQVSSVSSSQVAPA